MNQIKPAIEQTDDGTATLRHPVFGDTYHSTRGAAGESQHVFINNGLACIDKKEIRILEIGFGSGLNAWQSFLYARDNNINIDYHAIELYPVAVEVAANLGYTDNPAFIDMHAAEWNSPFTLSDSFVLTKWNADLTGRDKSWLNGEYDIVFFDAFAPDTQSEMWSAKVFQMLYDNISPNGILVTYSAKGIVKQALRDAGFDVKRLKGALGKRHMIRAEKHILP